jgi:hypothetical protein
MVLTKPSVPSPNALPMSLPLSANYFSATPIFEGTMALSGSANKYQVSILHKIENVDAIFTALPSPD